VRDVKDVKTISLVVCGYKALAEVLSNRFKNVRGELSSNTHAFIHGRKILDFVITANKCLDSRLKEGHPRSVM